MSCQPDDTLVAQDRDDLARLAAELGRLDEALAHAQAALQSGSGAGQFERQCMVVDLLARLGKTAEAAENARRWATATGATTEQLTAMGELLAKSGNEAAGDELFVRALAAKQLTRQQRFGVMRRLRADSSSEPAVATLAGCRRSYASRLARPPQMLGHDCRRVGRAQPGGGCRATGQPDARPGTQVGIDVAQARLSIGVEDRGEVYWRIYQAGRLPESCFDTAFIAWNAATQPQRVIEVAEEWLRSGKRLSSPGGLFDLQIAYRAAGRAR